MTRPEQTERELKCVAQMIELRRLRVDGQPLSGDPECGEPDVLFTLRDAGVARRIGVEVCDVDDERRSESWSATLPRFQTHIRQLLVRDANNVLVSGYLYIEDVRMIRRRLHAASTAETVAALAREWVASPTDQPVHKSVLRQRGLEMFRHIRFQNATKPDVSFATSGLPLERDALQSAIDAKAERLRNRYLYSGVDEVWLLIVARGPISGYVESSGDECCDYATPFARTLFLDARGGECVDLGPAPE